MKNKLSVILATLALVIALGVAIYNVYVLSHLQGLTFGGTTNYDTLSLSDELIVGANATSTLTSGDIVANGVNLSYRQVAFNNSSTTLCSFPNPALNSGASSTVSRLVIDFRVATSVDRLIQVGTSTANNTATTTIWFSQVLPANQKRTFIYDFITAAIASTSYKNVPGAWLGYPILGSNDRLVVNEGGTVGTEVGDCSAEFLRP